MINRAKKKNAGVIFGLFVILAQGAFASSFSYNYNNPTDGGQNDGFDAGYTSSPGPWVYNSTQKWQRRVRADYGLQGGIPGGSFGLTMRSREDNGNGTITGIYNGSTTTVPSTTLSLDLSGVGATFKMSIGWTPNPARTLQAAGSNVGNLIAMMGMVSVPTPASLNTMYLGSSPSLFFAIRETGGTNVGTNQYSRSTMEIRNSLTTNATASDLANYGSKDFFVVPPTLGAYYYYMFELTFENMGYTSNLANFKVSTLLTTYISNPALGTNTLQSTQNLGSRTVASSLDAIELATMRPAVGNHILDGANVTVTGTTYDAFSTSVIPEPTALGLAALGLLAFAHLRKRKR